MGGSFVERVPSLGYPFAKVAGLAVVLDTPLHRLLARSASNSRLKIFLKTGKSVPESYRLTGVTQTRSGPPVCSCASHEVPVERAKVGAVELANV